MMHNEDYHDPSMTNPNEPSTSDQVLFKLKSEKEVAEKMLMRPPLPPPPVAAELPIIDYEYGESIKRKVRVVELNVPLHRWYHDHFNYKEYKDPKEEIFDLRSSDQIKPLDLSFKSAVTSTGTTAAAVATSTTENLFSTLKK